MAEAIEAVNLVKYSNYSKLKRLSNKLMFYYYELFRFLTLLTDGDRGLCHIEFDHCHYYENILLIKFK